MRVARCRNCRESPPQRGAINAILETRLVLAPDRALGRVGGDTLLTQVLRKRSAPHSQCRFPDIQPLPFLAHRRDDEVHMSSRANSRLANSSFSGGVPFGIERITL